jgi:hypothetical protein
MTESEFTNSVSTLQEEILGAITEHFGRQGYAFDVASFLQECQCGIDLVLQSAHFTGAEVFPVIIPTK